MRIQTIKLLKRVALAGLLALALGGVGCAVAGKALTMRSNQRVTRPEDLNAENIAFQSKSGATIKGWRIEGKANPHRGTALLLHGIRASRMDMIGRARFLAREGYTSILFDFQAHGESSGDQITFGHLEGKDVEAAVEYVRSQSPKEKIGVIGVSLGGAAAIVASPRIHVEAMILEMVFSTLEEATANRFAIALGDWSRFMTPLLTRQVEPRLGVGLETFRMVDRVRDIHTPKLFMAGSKDRHTTLEDSKALFEAAAGPKELWIVEGAPHCDLHSFSREEYEKRTLAFFKKHLAGD